MEACQQDPVRIPCGQQLPPSHLASLCLPVLPRSQSTEKVLTELTPHRRKLLYFHLKVNHMPKTGLYESFFQRE